MKEAEVLKYEAFTSSPGKGNPAGVVLQGDDYTEDEMQIIAERAGYSETSFIRKSEWPILNSVTLHLDTK